MAGVLNFSQYLGGPDQVNVEQVFPSDQRTLQYNFGHNISNWSFSVESQVVIVDTITFDRITGTPNFATSTIIGFFTATNIANTLYAQSPYVNVLNVNSGILNITIPSGLYTGPILPDARKNVPINVISVSWTDAGTPAQTASHRWAFIQCWEPGVIPGDPVQTKWNAIVTGILPTTGTNTTHIFLSDTNGFTNAGNSANNVVFTIGTSTYYVDQVVSQTAVLASVKINDIKPLIGQAITFYDNDLNRFYSLV